MQSLTCAPEGPERARLLLLPGNDLDAGFYEGLLRALARRGVHATALTLPGFAGEAPLAEPGWPALVRALGEEVARRLGGGGAPRGGDAEDGGGGRGGGGGGAGGGGDRGGAGGGAGGGILAGHSLGALAALLVAAAASEGSDNVPRGTSIRRLCLLEPFAPPARPIAAALSRTYLREVVHGDRARFRNGGSFFRRVHDLASFPRAAIERYLRVRLSSDPATAAALFRGLTALYPLPLERIAAPVLLLRGARSGLLPRLTQAALAARLRRASAAVLPSTGHWVANESDEAAAERIATFAG